MSGPAAAAPLAHALLGQLRTQAFLLATLFGVLLFGLSLLLISWRVEQVLVSLTQERTDRMVRELLDDGENAMRLGLTAGDLGFLQSAIERTALQEPALRMVTIALPDGQVIAFSGDTALRERIEPRWNARLLEAAEKARAARARATEVRNLPGLVLTGAAMLDPAGVPAATVWMLLDPGELRQQVREAASAIVMKSLLLIFVTVGVTYVALREWGGQTVRLLSHAEAPSSSGVSRLRRWFPVFLLIGLAIAPLGLIEIAREAARPFVTSQIQSNAAAGSVSLAARLERALQLGVPLHGLQGVDAFFRDQLAVSPELSTLTLRDANDREIARAGQGGKGGQPQNTSDVLERSAVLQGARGRIVVGYPADYVDRTLGAMVLDLLLALVISAVLMRELMRGFWRRSLLHPLLSYRLARGWQRFGRRRRGSRIGDKAGLAERTATMEAAARARAALGILSPGDKAAAATPQSPGLLDWGAQMTRLRLAVFLVALSEELLRPFFTVLASEMGSDTGWSPEMLAGIPVAAFMATFAAAQPIGPMLMRRFDIRPLLMHAALIGAGALGATVWVHDAWLLAALRAISGVAYGMALILVQTAVVRFTPAGQRARGLAEVAAPIVAAGIVGPPFGGMIAGRVGDVYGMLACAVAMALAFAAVWKLQLPGGSAQRPVRPAVSAGWRGYAAIIREPRAMCIILGSAVPARLVAVTVLSIVIPLSMREIGEPPAVAGRVLLLYFLCYALTSSLVAHWSDAADGRRRTFIVAGCLIAAAACFAVPLIGGTWGMAACCALLGAGQATQSSSQVAMVTELFEKQSAETRRATPEQALVAYRLLERLGSVAAPFLTALAVVWVGLTGALSAVGLLLMVAALSVWVGLRPRALVALPQGGAA